MERESEFGVNFDQMASRGRDLHSIGYSGAGDRSIRPLPDLGIIIGSTYSIGESRVRSTKLDSSATPEF
jgi:hypothetical protein